MSDRRINQRLLGFPVGDFDVCVPWSLIKLLSLFLAFAANCFGQTGSPNQLDFKPAQLLDEISGHVETSFYDPDLDVDGWRQQVEAVRPAINSVDSLDQFDHLVNQLLKQLNASHTSFFTRCNPKLYQLRGPSCPWWSRMAPMIRNCNEPCRSFPLLFRKKATAGDKMRANRQRVEAMSLRARAVACNVEAMKLHSKSVADKKTSADRSTAVRLFQTPRTIALHGCIPRCLSANWVSPDFQIQQWI